MVTHFSNPSPYEAAIAKKCKKIFLSKKNFLPMAKIVYDNVLFLVQIETWPLVTEPGVGQFR